MNVCNERVIDRDIERVKMACSKTNPSNCENEVYDFCVKTKRSILNSYKLKWIVDDFSILPVGKISSPVFQPLPDIDSHLELEISEDDLRIYLCMAQENVFVCCDICLFDVDGQLLYQKSSTTHSVERFDLTDVTMRGCFPKLKGAKDDKLILTFFMKMYGPAVTKVNSIGYCSTDIESLKKLSSDFLCAFKNSLNTDVILKCEDCNTVAAHKAILSARSPVFAKMFQLDMQEKSTEVVNVTDIRFDTLKKLVEFLYCGELCILDDVDTAYELYYAADKYGVLDLRNLCGNVLLSKLTVGNACKTLVRIDQHDDVSLKTKVIQYICLHLKDIINSQDWVEYMDSCLSAEVIKMSLL